MKIPEKLNRFKAYAENTDDNGNVTDDELIGITSEITLPNFEMMTETLSLAGALGEIDSPSPGQFQSSTMDIPFSNIDENGMKVAKDSAGLKLVGQQEVLDTATYKKSFIKRTITVRGFTKGINLGNLKKAGYGEPTISKEVGYYKDVIDYRDGSEPVTLIEIDKLNGVYNINGESQLPTDIFD